MFESYIKKIEEAKASPSNFSGLPVKPVGSFANTPAPKGYDAMQNMINMKLAAKDKKKSEDEEMTCKYAKEGCDCDGCEDCKKNQMSEGNESSGDDIMARIEQKRKARKNIGDVRSEDAETWGVENKLKEALHEIEGVGYTGDGLDPKQVATLVVGSQADWGDSYGPLVQALTHVIEAYYGKGIQDS